MASTQDTTAKIREKARAVSSGIMAKSTKVSGRQAKSTDLGFGGTIKATAMKDSGVMEDSKVRAPSKTKTISTKTNCSTATNTERESITYLTETITKALSSVARRMGLAGTPGKMETTTKVSLWKDTGRGRENCMRIG